jgi:hypothetical protein
MEDGRWKMEDGRWGRIFGCWMLDVGFGSHTKTRRHEGGKMGGVSLEDLKVEGGEIDDPTSLVELPSSHKL